MGNRKKLRINGKRSNLFRNKKKRTEVSGRGPAGIMSGNAVDLVSRLYSQEGLDARVEEKGHLIWNYDSLVKLGINNGIDGDETTQVVRVVTAKADGVPTGLAFVWDDGTISYWEDKDSDPEALAKVHKVANEVGYSLEEGRPFAIGEPGGPDGPPKED